MEIIGNNEIHAVDIHPVFEAFLDYLLCNYFVSHYNVFPPFSHESSPAATSDCRVELRNQTLRRSSLIEFHSQLKAVLEMTFFAFIGSLMTSSSSKNSKKNSFTRENQFISENVDHNFIINNLEWTFLNLFLLDIYRKLLKVFYFC